MAGDMIGLDRRDESDDRKEGGVDTDGANDPRCVPVIKGTASCPRTFCRAVARGSYFRNSCS